MLIQKERLIRIFVLTVFFSSVCSAGTLYGLMPVEEGKAFPKAEGTSGREISGRDGEGEEGPAAGGAEDRTRRYQQPGAREIDRIKEKKRVIIEEVRKTDKTKPKEVRLRPFQRPETETGPDKTSAGKKASGAEYDGKDEMAVKIFIFVMVLFAAVIFTRGIVRNR